MDRVDGPTGSSYDGESSEDLVDQEKKVPDSKVSERLDVGGASWWLNFVTVSVSLSVCAVVLLLSRTGSEVRQTFYLKRVSINI